MQLLRHFSSVTTLRGFYRQPLQFNAQIEGAHLYLNPAQPSAKRRTGSAVRWFNLKRRPLSPATQIILVAVVSLSQIPSAIATEEGDPPNTGQDLTRPVRRVDLRMGYTHTPADRNSFPLTLRTDMPFTLGNGWKLGTRFDLPFVFNNVARTDNPTGEYRLGRMDLLAQALLIKTINTGQAVGFGTQVIAPTGNQDPRWRLVPSFGYRTALPGISHGSFFVVGVRYDISVDGGAEQSKSRNMQFAPTLNVALPGDTFLTFFPSTDIRYNFISNSWFLPFEAQAGKLWDKKFVTSFKFSIPMHQGETPLYKLKLEARVGWFF